MLNRFSIKFSLVALVFSSFQLSLRNIFSDIESRSTVNSLLNLFGTSVQCNCKITALHFMFPTILNQNVIQETAQVNLPRSKRCYFHPLVGLCLGTLQSHVQ